MSTKVELIITGDSDDAIRAIETLRRAEQQHAAGLKDIDREQRKVETSAVSVASAYGAVAGAMAALGIGLFVSDLYRVNAEFDRLHAGLVTVTGSLPQANAEFARLEEFATRTPYQLTEVVTAFNRLSALNLDASSASLESYGNTASAMGKSMMDMIEAVADASTGEFERLKEFGIKARQEGDKVIFTFRGVSTEVSKDATAIQQYLLKIGQTDFAGGMARQMDTIGGAASNFADQYDKMVRTVGQKLPIQEGIETATAALKLLTENLDAVAVGFGVMAASAATQTIIANIGAITTAVRTLAASTALATGGMSLLLGVGAVALYEAGTMLADALDETGESAAAAGGAMEMMASHANTAATSASVLAKAQEDAKKAQEEHAKAVKAAESQLERYSRTISDLGREQLRLAESGFSRDMQRQADYFTHTATAAANLTAPIQSYLAVINQVYGAQRTAQEAVLATLEQIGASDAARLQQQINLGTVEKTMLEERRKAWNTYASDVEKLVTTAWDNIAKKEEALLQSRLATQGMLDALSAVASPKIEKDAFTANLEEKDRLRELERKAMASANPAEQVRLLSEAQQGWANLRGEVKIGEDVLVDAATAARDSIIEVERLGQAIEAVRQQEAAQAAEALQNLVMAKGEAEKALTELDTAIQALDTRIAGMTRTITLTGNDKTTPVVDTIKKALDTLKDKTITITANYVSNIPSAVAAAIGGAEDFGAAGFVGPPTRAQSSSSNPNAPFGTYSPSNLVGSFAVGTPYVPRTGLALVHEGERIIPAEENRRGNFGGQTIQFNGDMHFNLPNVTNQSTARDLAREALPEIMRLMRERFRAA